MSGHFKNSMNDLISYQTYIGLEFYRNTKQVMSSRNNIIKLIFQFRI